MVIEVITATGVSVMYRLPNNHGPVSSDWLNEFTRQATLQPFDPNALRSVVLQS